MEIEVKELAKRDFNKAIDFAIKGMHFERYTDNKLSLRLYGRYFLYLELERATQVFAAYMDTQLLGILMADIKNENKIYSSFWRRIYLRIFKGIMALVVKDGPDAYDEANKAILDDYLRKNTPDGEICFLAADTAIQGKGIGSLLIKELSRREKDKLIYLFTDNNCTYRFYEHKGFERAEEKEIEMDLRGKVLQLTCFLYSKQF
ncbi:GNAT family N-acetyltransferase [Bacillota bacterium]